MADLNKINWPRTYRPTAAEWATALNQVIDFLLEGVPASYLAVDGGGRVPIDISGDSDTVGGYTALELLGGELPDFLKIIALFFVPSSGLVLSGGAVTQDPVEADTVDISAIIALVKDTTTGFVSYIELAATSKVTSTPSTTYYLDLAPDAVDYSWGTSHPAGDYTPIAEVTTDGSGDVASITDARILEAEILSGLDAQLTFPTSWLGNGTIDDTVAPSGDTAAFATLLNNLANRIKAITGGANWRANPAATISALNTAVGTNTSNIGTLTSTVGGHTTSISTLQALAQAGRVRSFLGV